MLAKIDIINIKKYVNNNKVKDYLGTKTNMFIAIHNTYEKHELNMKSIVNINIMVQWKFNIYNYCCKFLFLKVWGFREIACTVNIIFSLVNKKNVMDLDYQPNREYVPALKYNYMY